MPGLNVRASGYGPGGVLVPLGYDTSDEDGTFAFEGIPSAEGAPRLRFEVLDGRLDLLHGTDHEVADAGLSGPAPIRLVVPAPPVRANVPTSVLEERVAGIRVAPGEVELPLGGRVILTAEAYDTAGIPVAGVAFVWEAHNAAGEEVPVSQAGEVVGHAPGGLAVTAMGAGQRATAVVTVRDPRQAPGGGALTAAMAAADDDADAGPRWNDTNARSACAPANRVGLGRSEADWMPDRPWLGPQSERAAEAVTVGSANFTFAAPVVDLPGRGLDLRLDLVYNSRVWTRSEDQVAFDNDKGWPARAGRWVSAGSSVWAGRAACWLALTAPGIRTRCCG